MHKRRSIRLPHYNYRDAGAYFVTICTHQHGCIFGAIEEDNVTLSKLGQIAKNAWVAIPQHFAHVVLDHYVLMPNHIHGILFIKERSEANLGGRHAANEDHSKADSISCSTPIAVWWWIAYQQCIY